MALSARWLAAGCLLLVAAGALVLALSSDSHPEAPSTGGGPALAGKELQAQAAARTSTAPLPRRLPVRLDRQALLGRGLRAELPRERQAEERGGFGGPAEPEAHGALSPPGPAGEEEGAAAQPEARPLRSADAAGIRQAVQDSLPELKDCYEQWLKLDPQIAGTVKVSFAIDAADGGVAGGEPQALITDVKILDSSMKHLFMEGCVSSVFGDLRFQPPPGGRVAVTYPLRFDSDADR